MKKLLFLAALFLVSFGVVEPAFAQTASLVATVRPNPLRVEIIAPSDVTVGQWFDINVQVTNLGAETITKTVATIYTPSEISVKGPKKKTGDLTGGEAKTLIWRAKANTSGEFVVTVEVSGKLAGEEISAADTKVITAAGSLGHFLRRLIFGA